MTFIHELALLDTRQLRELICIRTINQLTFNAEAQRAQKKH